MITYKNDIPRAGRLAVVLHERLGTWSGQLRTRLQDRPTRWFETRSAADLAVALEGLAAPIVLIDLGRHVVEGLSDLAEAARTCPGAYLLVLDPGANAGVAELARELGATHVLSGFAPPPEVAGLLDRWINLAARATARGEWSRPLAATTPRGADEWLEAALS
jgi:hypothetical protein